MDYSKKQVELDIKKWVDSENSNHDTCGEYEYCCKCNKNHNHPCAYAYEEFYNSDNANNNKILTTVKKPCANRKTCAKKSTNKVCSKKSTSRSNSTKKVVSKIN